ncbi:hypothetical protein NO2_1690, partial [Candidatus Termititenax persephonae]
SGRASQEDPGAGWNPTGASDSERRDIKIDLAHTHSVDIPNYTGDSGGASADHTHSVALSGNTGANSVNHTHSVTLSGNTGNTGSGTAFDNRPSYYSLIYIRRCL